MMFMRHISLCIILQLVHTENCADLKNVEFAHLIMKVHITYIVQTKNKLFRLFFIYFIQNAVLRRKKAPLDRVGRKVKKKKFFFFRVGPKNRVGRDMGNR